MFVSFSFFSIVHLLFWSSQALIFILLYFFPQWTAAPPMFLPISSTPQPERRQTPQRRHSIEKETPTNVRQFQPPTKHSSKSLVSETTVLLLYISKLILHQVGLTRSFDWTRLAVLIFLDYISIGAFNMMYISDFQVFLIMVNDKNELLVSSVLVQLSNFFALAESKWNEQTNHKLLSLIARK